MKAQASVRTAYLPQDSLLRRHVADGDFLDCYRIRSAMKARPAAEIIVAFPGWAQLLLRLRRLVTAPFGLSNDGPVASDKLGIFPVETDTGDEVVAGFNDKHLNFRVSVLARDGFVHCATWVHPHNIGGRIYLATILPFHILIVRDSLRRVVKSELAAA